MKDNCLKRADKLINGPRRKSYGPVEDSFKRIATMWSIILKHNISPKDVALCMVALKLCRESNAHNIDNLDDIAGYTALAELVKDIK